MATACAVAACALQVCLAGDLAQLGAQPAGEITPAFEKKLASEFDYDKPSETETHFMKLASDAQAAGKVEEACVYLTQAARAQGIQDRLKEARATLEKARSLSPNSAYAIARLSLESGRITRREGHVDQARAQFESAYRIARDGRADSLAADAAHMLAVLLPFEQAAPWVDRGLAVAESSENPIARAWVGNLCFNWGESLADHGRHLDAALYFARAMAARSVQGDAATVRTAEFALAVELRALGAADQARAIQRRLLREATMAGEDTADILRELKVLEAAGKR
jgi:tetratricopeptide (TPR) repeat protein